MIPLLVRRGGRDINKMPRSLLYAERKRDSPQPQLMERTGWSLASHASRTHSATSFVSDHPVCAEQGGFATFY